MHQDFADGDLARFADTVILPLLAGKIIAQNFLCCLMKSITIACPDLLSSVEDDPGTIVLALEEPSRFRLRGMWM